MKSTNQQADDWAHKPERGSLLMLRMMIWVSLRLGRDIGRLILRGIALYFLLFGSDSRRASRQYLTRVLQRPARWSDMYKHFFWFAATIHDRIYLLNERYDMFDITVHGEAVILEAMEKDQGVFLIGAHLGSFEVIRSLARQHTRMKVVMGMYEENARKINRTMNAINPAIEQNIIGLGHVDSILKLNDYLNEGTFVSIIGDRSFNNESMQPVNLLNSPANMPIGPLRIAAILRRPVLFMVGLYLGGNRYEIHFEKLADFSQVERADRQKEIQKAMLSYASMLEKYCKQAPYNWFNFFDFWAEEKHPKKAEE